MAGKNGNDLGCWPAASQSHRVMRLELGRRGDADVLLTHSPEAENKFMDEGWGDQRLPVMQNDFIIAGPADDQAGISGGA